MVLLDSMDPGGSRQPKLRKWLGDPYPYRPAPVRMAVLSLPLAQANHPQGPGPADPKRHRQHPAQAPQQDGQDGGVEWARAAFGPEIRHIREDQEQEQM